MSVDKSEMTFIMPTITDHPIILWSNQHFRKLFGKPFIQKRILDMVVSEAQEDHNILGILLFGSVAANRHTWKSDIDLVFVYNAHEPNSGLVKYTNSGVVIDKFYVTLECLVENQRMVPYLLHVFAESEILFDRNGSVSPVVEEIRQYFTQHPEVQEEWMRLTQLHQVEKKGPKCGQVTIIDRWNQLEDKYSDGFRKRTFFNI